MKNTKILIIVMLAVLILPEIVSGQQRSRRKKKREREERVERPTDHLFIKQIYAGAYINSPRLGYAGNTGFFQAGIKPFAGYNITNWLSAGPILSLNYYYQWDTQNSYSAYDMNAAIFVRTLFFDRFFLQGEAGYNRLTNYNKQSVHYPTMFVGAGWVFDGGQFRNELALMFDISDNSRKYGALPFDYRIGFQTTF